jgi:hypothetical protein
VGISIRISRIYEYMIYSAYDTRYFYHVQQQGRNSKRLIPARDSGMDVLWLWLAVQRNDDDIFPPQHAPRRSQRTFV